MTSTIKYVLFKSFRLLMDLLTFIVGLFYLSKKNCLKPIKEKILFMNVKELTEQVKSGELTCEQIISAYQQRCKEVQPLVNAIVCDDFENAISLAKEYDRKIQTELNDDKENGESKNIVLKLPLLGVPFSCKNSVSIKSMPFDSGSLVRKGKKGIKDSTVIKKLRESGSIFTAMTNTPEIVMFWESSNHLYGRTKNPYDLSRIVGGSSGGEAALIASGASLFGVGTDVGGSIRIPSMCCGIFGHKTTPEVIENDLTYPSIQHWKPYTSCGPMCRYAVDLLPCLKAMAGEKHTILKLDEKVELGQLKIFYLINDDGNPIANKVNQEIKEAIIVAVKHFRNTYGNEIKELKLNEQVEKAFDYWHVALNRDGENVLVNTMNDNKGEFNIYTELIKSLFGLSKYTANLLAFTISQKFNVDPRSKRGQQLFTELNEFRVKMIKTLGPNGVLLCPLLPTSAVKHSTTSFNSFNLSYSVLVNVLKFPATQCPSGFDDNDLPIGFQVVTAPFNDRLSIAVAVELERLFGGWIEPSLA